MSMVHSLLVIYFFFFNDTATTEIYTLSLHDALPIRRGDQMTKPTAPEVYRHIVVPASIEKAFAVFTERFGDFKPAEHNLLAVAIAETRFEPRVGGHIYDRGIDGSECRWARVLVYEPPTRLVFSWDIGPTWQLVVDPN